MTEKELQALCAETCRIARAAGLFIREAKGTIRQSQIETKGLNDFVTRVDKESEEMIVFALKQVLPEADFLAEEQSALRTGAEYTWVIDPLDGTTNFIHGLPCFCVSIGLIKNDVPVLGVIYEVNQDECFYAWQGGGAFLNGESISCTSRNKLADSLLVTGFPYYDYSKIDEYLALFKHLMKNSRGMRRLGSAAADLAYVAAGRCDAFYEYSLKPWDVAAGAVIVREAGGLVSDFSGENGFLFNQEIVASASGIYDETLAVIQRFMLNPS
jgi:myo-inositol-1(or 4)-monophosphatase